jgi:predicted NAD/FAD-binding protein
MNKLQGIPNPGEHGSPGKILVSMNPIRIPHAPQSQHVYYHPLITSKSVQVAPHIREINNSGSIKFAGAWMGFGFHEDGFASGAHAARLIMHGYENTAPLDLFSNNVRLAERSHLVVWYRWLIRLVILTIQRILQIFGAVGGDCSKSL